MRSLHLRGVFVCLLLVLVAWVRQPIGAGQATGDLRITVLEGEDGVNIIQRKTAVRPVVEVRDRNNLPVAGAAVTFAIVGLGRGGGDTAVFAGNLKEVTATTDALGRATVTDLNPLGDGAFQIEVKASYQGQVGTANISQTNFQTVAQAEQAGKTPSQNATQSGAQSAGGAGGAGAAGAAGAGGASAGGMSTAMTVGLVAAGAAGGLVAVRQVTGGSGAGSGPQCTAQENRVQSAVNSLGQACTAGSAQCLSAYQTFIDTIGQWCSCLGQSPDAGTRQVVQQYIAQIQSAGFNTSSLSNCAR